MMQSVSRAQFPALKMEVYVVGSLTRCQRLISIVFISNQASLLPVVSHVLHVLHTCGAEASTSLAPHFER